MSARQVLLAFPTGTGSRRSSRPRYADHQPESALLKACLQLLALRGIPAWRSNTGAGRFRNATGEERFVRFGVKGQSDILGLIPLQIDGRRIGRLIAVETKVHGRAATDDQQVFIDFVNRAGGLGLIVYDVGELDAALREAMSERRRA